MKDDRALTTNSQLSTLDSQIPKGYKQTEVGVIPEDWDISDLNSVSSDVMQNGVFYKPSRKGSGVKLINVGDLYKRTPIDLELLDLFDANDSEKERFKVKNGDLFFTRSSVVPSGIAHCNVYLSNLAEDVVFDSHVIRARPNQQKVNPLYIFRFCISPIARKYLIAHAKTGSMTTIDQGVLGRCPIILPTIAEQNLIARALSDTDALIESLEQLLAKKRQLKQGAMQELLRPKSGWVFKSIEELCVLGGLVRGPFGGALKKDCFVDSGFKVYEQRNAIYKSIEIGSYFIDFEKYQELKRFEVNPKDFIISCSGTIGRIYCIPEGAPPGVINQALLKLKINAEKFSEEYFYHYFRWENFQDKIIDNTQGGAMKNLVGMPIFKATKIPLPMKLEDQQAIATILSDMDLEIGAIATKLTKARQLKQGMMHELLTGRIRLIEGAPS